MRNKLYIVFCLFVILTGSCSQNSESINDPEKRDDKHVYIIDSNSGIGRWYEMDEQGDNISGEYFLFFKSGTMRQKGKVHNLKKVDTVYNYDINGDLFSREVITGDTSFFLFREGTYKLHYPSGQLFETGEILGNQNHEVQTRYFESGNIMWERKLKHGKQDGFNNWYYENGNVEEKSTYKNDQLHGKYISFFENGQMESEGNFFHGEKSGKWKIGNRNGSVREEISYPIYADSIYKKSGE